jgi:dolichol-phosphate mannosyltransferase
MNQPETVLENVPSRTKVIIVLPAYNEAANIGRLLERIETAMDDRKIHYLVIVVDDGSRDKTADVLETFRHQIPLVVHRHIVNQGLGPTIRDGLREASVLAGPRDIIVTMDADDTHPPGLIPRMLGSVAEGRDVVIASRYQPGAHVHGLSQFRTWISIVASWLFRMRYPTQGVKDYTCGFRAYRSAVLKQAQERYGDEFVQAQGFHCMVEILLKLRQLDLIFGEVPLILRYDFKRGESKMRVARTIKDTLRLLVRNRIG